VLTPSGLQAKVRHLQLHLAGFGLGGAYRNGFIEESNNVRSTPITVVPHHGLTGSGGGGGPWFGNRKGSPKAAPNIIGTTGAGAGVGATGLFATGRALAGFGGGPATPSKL